MKKHILYSIILTLFFCSIINYLHAQIISTIAGINAGGYSGDSGPATVATLNQPISLSIDNFGNIYIVDLLNFRIRQINSSGIISTIAGNGTIGFSGDGNAATLSQLNYPYSVAADHFGNIYLADWANQRIRAINSSGIINTIAGNGTTGFSGDGGPATAAAIHYPTAVATDNNGNIYFVDQQNERIRKINNSGIITTIAGNGISGFSGDGGAATAARLSHPSGLAIDSLINIYIADEGNARIRKINASGIITTIAGNGASSFSGDGGAAIAAGIPNPANVAVDNLGNVYVVDLLDNRIRKINTFGIINTIAGNGTLGFSGDSEPATAAQLNQPNGVVVDNSGNMYIADGGNNRIRKVTNVNTGIYQPSKTNTTLQIYPNPATNMFALSIATNGILISASLIDITGKIITTQTANNNPNPILTFSTQNLPAGNYFVLVTIDGNIYAEKIAIANKI